MGSQAKIELYLKQCETLKTLLSHGAISIEQYNKSFNDLTIKMNMQDYAEQFKIKNPVG